MNCAHRFVVCYPSEKRGEHAQYVLQGGAPLDDDDDEAGFDLCTKLWNLVRSPLRTFFGTNRL